ncbi:E3 ubiquitin-protein ligase CCNB1IP1-like [Saccoglossus kowalevskii]
MSSSYGPFVAASEALNVHVLACSMCHQEKTYQEYMANKNKERITQLEQYYEQILTRTQTEIKSLKTQISAAKKEIETTKKRFSEVSDKLMERNRQYQKLQTMYDALRRRTINASSFDTGVKDMSGKFGNVTGTFDIPIATGESVLGHPVRDNTMMHQTPTRPEHEFVFRPSGSTNTTPVLAGGDNAALQNRFSLDLGTPTEITRRLNVRK